MDIDKLILCVLEGQRVEKEAFITVVEEFKKLLKKEENLLHLNGDFCVFGDIHGQFYDFINMLKSIVIIKDGKIEISRNLLFLGDLVDRGYNSVEVLIICMLLKIKWENQVFLIRGNHETRLQTAVYGFMTECINKYDLIMYWKVCDMFNYLPLAAIINGSYFCIHGGIIPDLNSDSFKELNRVKDNCNMFEVMWGDPVDDIDEFIESDRGAGFLFGKTATERFLLHFRCKFLVRSHQLVYEGVLEQFDGKCITIWSAPNYAYKNKNKAVIMNITGNSHTYTYFDAVQNQYKEKDVFYLSK
ncbi:Serine threonine-protein phosphatase PP2A catalytic subunit [Nucleospora cyclopteri]